MSSRARSALWGVYHELGRRAASFLDDPCVVRAYELARACGDVARAGAGEFCQDDDYLRVRGLLSRASEDDSSGALALFAFATVLGPWLLVGLGETTNDRHDSSTRATFANDVTDVIIRESSDIYALFDESRTIDLGARTRKLAEVFDA